MHIYLKQLESVTTNRKMRRQIAVILLVVLTAVNFGTASRASQNRLLQIARANDDFGYQLLHRLEVKEHSNRGANGEPENLLISPFSISTVLTMVMAGAKENTFNEIKSTLG